MEILYRRGEASAAQVRAELPEAPGYSAVRALLRVLEQKGHLRHQERGLRYVFVPMVSRQKATRSAVRHLVNTFFAGSVEQTVAALLDPPSTRLSAGQLDRLAALIEQARRKGV